MKEPRKTFLYWAPRVLSILFAAFISIFALDVFGEGYKFGELLVALFMHLIPTFVMVTAIVVGWKHEWLSAIVFIGLAILYLSEAGFDFDFITLLLIPLPSFITGVLYLFSWQQRKQYQALFPPSKE